MRGAWRAGVRQPPVSRSTCTRNRRLTPPARPGGVTIPAWKAVFFNPKTDEAIVDRLVESIEEVA